jgi:hypothetical protein
MIEVIFYSVLGLTLLEVLAAALILGPAFWSRPRRRASP